MYCNTQIIKYIIVYDMYFQSTTITGLKLGQYFDELDDPLTKQVRSSDVVTCFSKNRDVCQKLHFKYSTSLSNKQVAIIQCDSTVY